MSKHDVSKYIAELKDGEKLQLETYLALRTKKVVKK